MQDPDSGECANEHPIKFAAKLIPSLRNGSKTVTRRPISIQPPFEKVEIIITEEAILRYMSSVTKIVFPEEGIPSPYGRVGSRLWIQEPFLQMPSPEIVKYQADYIGTEEAKGVRWEWAHNMPRELSRIETKVVSIYPETLMGISSEDAAREMGQDPKEATVGTRNEFFEYWNSIYGRGAHQRNPWVWVIWFQKCTNIK